MKSLQWLQILKFSIFVILLILMISCQPKTIIDIQGHRGCRGLYPENSLPAFEHVIDIGVITLELDIAVTKNYKVVVSHEPFMSQTICLKPNGEELTEADDMAYNLYKMTHDEIKQFDCGIKFHKRFPNQNKIKVYKPLLKEVFDLAKSKKANVKFNIEIKSKPEYYGIYTPKPSEYVKLVLDEIIDAEMFNHVNLQSFDLKILEEVKKQSPKMPVALLVDEDETIEGKLSKLSYKPKIISPYFKLLSKERVKELKSENFQVIPWTVNTKDYMLQMIDFEVNGIITDYPDLLISILDSN